MRQVLAEAITREVRDPRVGLVTLTRVEVSGDLSHATVAVLAPGDDAERARAFFARVGQAAPRWNARLASRPGPGGARPRGSRRAMRWTSRTGPRAQGAPRSRAPSPRWSPATAP